MSRSAGFQFKQFTVAHDQCAMKVSLDACLLGALCDVSDLSATNMILDIGTGTGLLALMAAQRCHANIDAVELDIDAAQQARDNIANSPFASRIRVHQQSIQQFRLKAAQQKYDRIICNPPFFSQHLTGNNAKRNLARHNTQLSFTDLCQSMDALLSTKGQAWLLLPQHEHAHFLAQANRNSLHLVKQYNIMARQNKASKLGIWVYARQPSAVISEENIIIYQPDNSHYSAAFSKILADYYLKL